MARSYIAVARECKLIKQFIDRNLPAVEIGGSRAGNDGWMGSLRLLGLL
jgi:hypothetical protein